MPPVAKQHGNGAKTGVARELARTTGTMVGRDHHPCKDGVAQLAQDFGCDAFARAGAEGHAIGHQLRLEVGSDATAATSSSARCFSVVILSLR